MWLELSVATMKPIVDCKDGGEVRRANYSTLARWNYHRWAFSATSHLIHGCNVLHFFLTSEECRFIQEKGKNLNDCVTVSLFPLPRVHCVCVVEDTKAQTILVICLDYQVEINGYGIETRSISNICCSSLLFPAHITRKYLVGNDNKFYNIT